MVKSQAIAALQIRYKLLESCTQMANQERRLWSFAAAREAVRGRMSVGKGLLTQRSKAKSQQPYRTAQLPHGERGRWRMLL